ncbi:ribonucleotide reductase large subunit RNR1 [Aspergillus luchuensis]|uniref:Ribonucleotide reductase large subunit RNR1 n=1 Tax=Aspergillus kawachii TaxID=1069201 RepID=A0A146F825_ASPKA|nr:ribonucleotide reductase large subunit RNR1 [Aspergillus luchuensis]
MQSSVTSPDMHLGISANSNVHIEYAFNYTARSDLGGNNRPVVYSVNENTWPEDEDLGH